MLTLQKSLLPLIVPSKLLGLCVYSTNPFKPSYFGTIIALCGATIFSFFFLIDKSDEISIKEVSNDFVANILFLYDHYGDLTTMMIYILFGILLQGKLVKALQMIQDVDQVFTDELNVKINNWTIFWYFIFWGIV